MKLREIYKIADAIAPKSLSDEYCATYGAYDNSGILVDTGEDVCGIVFSLDLSFAAIDRALKEGANLIITHHPAIYGKISDVRADDGSTIGQKLITCIKNGISVIAMHLNLDCAEDGIDENLMNGILCSAGKAEGAGTDSSQKMHPVSHGAYGRAYDLPPVTLEALAADMEKTFSTKRILVYGNRQRKLTRAASFCGAGADEESVAFAKEQGADVIISSDFKHHLLTLAQESGMAIIALTHYASENYGFEKYYRKICRQVQLPCVYHTDENLF